MNKTIIKSLSCCQISKLIKKGDHVNELKKEWFSRWSLDYPLYKDCTGIKNFE